MPGPRVYRENENVSGAPPGWSFDAMGTAIWESGVAIADYKEALLFRVRQSPLMLFLVTFVLIAMLVYTISLIWRDGRHSYRYYIKGIPLFMFERRSKAALASPRGRSRERSASVSR